MPNCREMSELVTDYLERVLPIGKRLEMRWHLILCEACRRYYDQMRSTVRLLGKGSPRPPDGATEESVLASARDARERRP